MRITRLDIVYRRYALAIVPNQLDYPNLKPDSVLLEVEDMSRLKIKLGKRTRALLITV